jgi:glycosyltransferase involved in cell wall biosynthesis
VRVLHVTPYFAPAHRYGGPPASILGLCKALLRSGVDVEVVTTTANGRTPLPPSAAEPDHYEGVPVQYVPAAFPHRFFGARIRQPLADAIERADLCHIHGVWNVPEWWASHLSRAGGVPYVISPRGMLQPQAMRRGRARKAVVYALLERRNLSHAVLLHATSRQEADAIEALRLGVKVAIVPNGVDLSAAQCAAKGYRARLGIRPQDFVVLFLGRMHRIKRIDVIAEAFARLRAVHPSAHLVLAGPDEHGLLPDAMRRLASHAGAVHAMDAVNPSDKWALLKDADVMVQASDSESFGVAVVEALAAGVPVVAARTTPWRELEQRDCGCWVEQSAPAIADALRALADDPGRRAAMGERAAAFAREAFGWDAVAPAMARLYAEVT